MSENELTIPLETNSFNLKVMWKPTLLTAAVVASGLGGVTLVNTMVTPLEGIWGTLVLLVGAITFVVSRRLFVPKLCLVISPDRAVVMDARKADAIHDCATEELTLTAGYYHVTTRYASGFAPVIRVVMPGMDPWVFGYRDYYHAYVWEGDSHEEKRFTNPTDLPAPTHLITGAAFTFLARVLIPSPALEVTPLRT